MPLRIAHALMGAMEYPTLREAPFTMATIHGKDSVVIRYILNGRRAQKEWLWRSLLFYDVYCAGTLAPDSKVMECRSSGNVMKTAREWFDEWGFPNSLKELM